MSIRALFHSLILLFGISLAIASQAQAKSLIIGTTDNYPPFSFKKNGEMHGLEPELATLLGKHLGRAIEFRSMPIDQRIPALLNGSIDVIMAGMSITPDRAQQVNFTLPITSTGQMAIIHQRNIGTLGELNQISRSGRRIGVKKNTSGEKLVNEKYPAALVFRFDTIDIALGALAGDELDYVIHDAQTSWLINQNREFNDLISLNQLINNEQIAWAVSPRQVALQQELNQFIAEIKHNGVLDNLLRKWIPLKVSTNH